MTPFANNPYVAGNPVGGGSAFVGRDDIMTSVLRVLGDQQHHGMVLYGQRRIGKTSILQHLAQWLPEQGGFRAIYFDLQDKAAWSVGKVVEHLAFAIAEALDLAEPVPGPDPELWFRHTWLPPVLAQLPPSERLVVLLDEFDVLADAKSSQSASSTLFAYLRELLAATAPRLRFVFVIGRNIEDLSYLAQPLFKALPAARVSLLAPPDAENLVLLSEDNNTLAWRKDAITATWELTHGHPYLLQHLCWQIWQRAHYGSKAGGGVYTVALADIEAAIPRTLDASRNALEWLWGGLPPAERVVASALAEAGSGTISQETLERVLRDSGVRVLLRELRDAPKLLQEWDLIEPYDGGYRFRVELLRRWIAQFKPLGRVQEELDHVLPLAENLYRAGEGFYRTDNLAAAMSQLRQAIGVNPNHLRASELLAEILIRREEWSEARRLLDNLYENYPAAARPRLVQVLLAEAQAASDEEDELKHYDRVLALEKNSAAAAGRQRIWKNRGDRARAEERIEDAIEAYREAAIPELEKIACDELRTKGVARITAKIQAQEEAGHYSEALETIRQAETNFGALKNWKLDRARIEQAIEMAADYQRAIGAIESGDKKIAESLLTKIISVEPRYKNAVKALYETVSGHDMDVLLEMSRAGAQSDSLRRREKRLRWIAVLESALVVAIVGWIALRPTAPIIARDGEVILIASNVISALPMLTPGEPSPPPALAVSSPNDEPSTAPTTASPPPTQTLPRAPRPSAVPTGTAEKPAMCKPNGGKCLADGDCCSHLCFKKSCHANDYD